MKVLVTGWFSFDCGHATAGDVLAKDVVRDWLREAGYTVDVAATPPFEGDLIWEAAIPAEYVAIVFVCGPFRQGWPLTEYLDHFAGRPLLGVNVSMLNPVVSWNPFDFLFERDTTTSSRPDITLVSEGKLAPVVGLVLVHPQSEYGERQRHSQVNNLVTDMLAAHDVAVVPIDTRLDANGVGLRSSAQVEGLIARMDAVVTTRLHGMVLALKNGVPALAIDPIQGGAKIHAQAAALGWPIAFTPDEISAHSLDEAFTYVLTKEARALAAECRDRGRAVAASMKEPFLAAIQQVSYREPASVAESTRASI